MRLLVTFISPKRSARTLQVAAEHALALGAEIIVLKVVPDAHKVGVVAELIASDRPTQKATQQVAKAAHELDRQGIAARGVVLVDDVTEGILRASIEWHADAVYVGTHQSPDTLRLQNDPIARFLIDRCPANVILVRQVDPGGDDQMRVPVPPLSSAQLNGGGAFRFKKVLLGLALMVLLFLFALRFANTHQTVDSSSDAALTRSTTASLMDWHVSGLWVINSPVAWVRITNNSPYPIKDITLEYRTYGANGKLLDVGTYLIEDTRGGPAVVRPYDAHNFIELYLGVIHLESERLTVKLLSVKRA
jgi:nucleotide-binding universal stress UspA family protein